MAARKRASGRKALATGVVVYDCKVLKAALAKELRSAVKDRELRNQLIERLSGEVAYGTGGGGGGIGVA
jgi:hypothetical protein